MTRKLLAAFALLAAGVVTAAEPSPSSLAAKIEAITDAPDYKRGHWGVLFVDARTGERVYERNAGRMFCPASVTKLFTTAAAVAAFGPDHTFETPVHARGEVSKTGVLKGDLILVAQGDLMFGGRTGKDGKAAFANVDHTYANSGLGEAALPDTNPLAALEDLAAQVKAAGVAEVTGEVLIDDRLFARASSTGSGPDAITPMFINDNCVDVLVTPGAKAGDPATVTVRPESSVIRLDALVETADKAFAPMLVLTHAGPGQFVVRGRVPAGGKPQVRIFPVDDPAGFARSLFVECLRKTGVKVAAAVARPGAAELPTKKEYDGLKRVAVHKSAPFGEALKVTLKVSHNLYASALPRLLAAKEGKSTLDDGLRLERQHLRKLGVDLEGVSFGGGAGGSRVDAVTPDATVQLLQGLMKRPDWPRYKEWLPVLGEDGTLATAVDKDSPARGKVFAKTGTYVLTDTLNGRPFLLSKALGGVMTTASGRELVFAVYVNDLPLKPLGTAAQVGKTLGKVCEVVYAECK